MKHAIFAIMLSALASTTIAQGKLKNNEIAINGFRNPSIGVEYRHHQVSAHAGYYTTAFKSGEYTNFLKVGLNYWFLPVDKKEIPSSFYFGAAFMHGLNRNYKGKNALSLETGFRWMAWQGLNLRIGVIAVSSKGSSVKINPTPGISYSFKLKK